MPFPIHFQSTWSKVCILDPQSVGAVVQPLRHVQLFATPWTLAYQASLSFTISRSFLKLMSIESVMPSNHLIFCSSFPLLPLIFPSIRVFSNESALHIKWPKYWSFSFSISPSKEYSGLISFRIDWFDFLAVQGILKSLLQHHNSKASIIQCSALYGPTLTSVHDLTVHSFDFWGRKWQPTPVFLPEKSQGPGSLIGWGLWGRTGLDTTERLSSGRSRHSDNTVERQ